VAQPLRLCAAWRGKSSRISTPCGRAALRSHDCSAISLEDFNMSQLVAFAKSFVRDEDGQDLLEYALLVALIALIAIGAVGLAGGAVNTIFTNIAQKLTAAA
jgi:pilus assembly protein Flp/PilA